jgi:high-affinity iron transporter
MLASLTISFRECLEAVILITSLLTYIYKKQKRELGRFILAGTALGVVSSIITGIAVFKNVQHLQGVARQIFDGSMMIFVAGLVAYSVLKIRNKADYSDTSKNMEDDYSIETTAFNMFIIPFIVVYRESLEIIMFILPLAYENPLDIIMGIFIGFALSLIFMLLIFKAVIKLKTDTIFKILSVILIFIGATMFGEGISELLANKNETITTTAKLIYAVPLLYLFLKREMKRFINKQRYGK